MKRAGRAAVGLLIAVLLSACGETASEPGGPAESAPDFTLER